MDCPEYIRGTNMTAIQKRQIEDMRISGMGYKSIAARLSLSVNTVKSYLRNHPVTATTDTPTCPVCGSLIVNTPHKRKRKYCSDHCRMTWWNNHRDRVYVSAEHFSNCMNCGKTIISYGSVKRLYCSRTCYIDHRFGRISNE